MKLVIEIKDSLTLQDACLARGIQGLSDDDAAAKLGDDLANVVAQSAIVGAKQRETTSADAERFAAVRANIAVTKE